MAMEAAISSTASARPGSPRVVVAATIGKRMVRLPGLRLLRNGCCRRRKKIARADAMN
jgi:hypothetical protein